MSRRSFFLPRKKYYPVSTAENAYQLIDEVIAAIREEPKRVNMGMWVHTVECLRELYPAARTKPTALPECGTIACVAGWVVGLAEPEKLRAFQISETGNSATIAHVAARILGWLFYDASTFTMFAAHGADIDHLKPGTKRYVEAVVARIRAFQREHAERLINTSIQRLNTLN